jgi:hypothetical protein
MVAIRELSFHNTNNGFFCGEPPYLAFESVSGRGKALPPGIKYLEALTGPAGHRFKG